ncbi:uncharacterized protein J8A68_004451 [[Candida] subhashii]|uniref:xylan 1,4-beta-xylosidase n=1 Tax=[Candida] subhashii TaxID=561895 RepID=A0A8J5QKE5_9ASCO|nr:uncharacterized protein J8A68_004451 [[Candida] subhashii]KAG7662063.1 hypothetical protein J8A68_004451 [[Candida] subhashii]
MLPIQLLVSLAFVLFGTNALTPPASPDYNTEANPQLPSVLFQLDNYTFPDCKNGPLKDNLVCNERASPNERARALIEKFTTEDLIANTGNTSPGVPSLGLPPYQWWQEALHGIDRANFTASGEFQHATSFPQPILMGGAFNDPLYKQVGDVISTEARAFNNAGRYGLDGWAPNINPFRDSRWGRGQEVASEAPVQVGRYAYNLVQGIQGGLDNDNTDKLKMAATCKHFAGYDMEGWDGHSRLGYNAIISEQDLSDYYTPSFQHCVRDGRAASVMCSYNAVNGVPACANEYLLKDILRDSYDWQDGLIVSDCDAIYNVWNPHMYAEDMTGASADALKATVDVNCGTTYPENLGYALGNNTINVGQLKAALTRQYATLIRLGYFDDPENQPYRKLGWNDVATPEAQQIAYQAAVEGLALLKNDGTLPFDRKIKNVAVIGPWANATTQMQGDYAGVAPYLISPLQGAQGDYHVTYALGTQINTTSTAGFSEALNAAKHADAIVYLGGIDNSIENEALDRESITWPGNQLELVKQLSELKKPLAVVQFGAGQIDDTELKNNKHVNSILYAGYPGQSGGKAIFDVISGKYAPAGRLTTTQYPASYADEVPMTDMSLRPSGSFPGRTFMWYNKEPVYEYGHGLHYTTFKASPVGSDKKSVNIQQAIASVHNTYVDQGVVATFTAAIKNTGKVTSDFAALLYGKTTAGPGPHANKVLVDYTKLHQIAPKKSQNAEFTVTLGSIAQADTQGNKWVYPGTYTLFVDNDKLTSFTVTLTGKAAIVQQFPQSK